MKNHIDMLIFHTGICAEASQIPLIAEQNLIFCSRSQHGMLRDGGKNERRIAGNYREKQPH